MRCAVAGCGGDTKVLETRGAVYRKRECLKCGHRFRTVEVIEAAASVGKKNAAPEDEKALRRREARKKMLLLEKRRAIDARREALRHAREEADPYGGEYDYLPDA